MFKKIIWLLLLSFLVWLFQSVFEIFFPFPTDNLASSFLDLEKEGDRNILLLVRYIFWMVFLYVIIKLIGPFLSFMMPWTRRYSVTKPLRRVQGVFYEIGLFLLSFCFCLFLISGPIGGIQVFDQLLTIEKQNFQEEYQLSLNNRKARREELIQIAIKGNDLLETKAKTIYSKFYSKRVLPTRFDDFSTEAFRVPYDNYYRKTNDNSPSLKLKKAEKDSILSIKYYWPTTRYPNPASTQVRSKWSQARIPGRSKFETLLKVVPYLNTREKTLYNRLEQEYIQTSSAYKKSATDLLGLIEEPSETPNFTNYFAELGPESSQSTELYKKYTWAKIKKHPSILLFPSLFELWYIALLFGLIVYALFQGSARYRLSKNYEILARVLEQGRFGLGGSSRFAGILEEWANVYKKQNNALFLGRSLYNPRLLIGSEDKRHMLTVAATRAGKGTTAIIPNLLLWEGSALIIDPKGTNASVTAQRRKEMGQNVYVVDPFGITGIKSDHFNPLENLDPNSSFVREEINLIAEALVVPDPEQKEKHWDDSARTVIAGLIAQLISSGKTDKPTLSMIRDLIHLPPKDQEELWIDMILNEKAGKLAKDAGSRIMRGLGTNEMSSILSNADKHTEWLSSPTMENCLSNSTFSFSELKEKPTTIYLVLPPNKLVTYNRFLRLFVNLALSDVSSGKRSKTPVLMIMDEFLSLGRMEEVEKAFGLLAGYNLTLWPIVQETGKLKDIYKNSFSSFINNSRAIQVFGVFGDTAKFVSEALGERTTKGLFKKDQRERIAKLRTPNEVTIDVSIEDNWQYILRAGKAPMVLEKVSYYNHELFKGLYDQDPDYVTDNEE